MKLRVAIRVAAALALAAGLGGCATLGSMSDIEVWTLGDEALYRGEHKAAIAYYDELLRRNPENAAVLARRGLAHDRTGNEAQAREDYTAAIARAPQAPLPYLYRANLALRGGQAEAALADVAALDALPLDPHDRAAALVLGGAAWAQRGEFARAVAAYERAIELGRRDPSPLLRKHYQDALYNAAHAYYHLGAFDRAAAAYRELLRSKAQHRQPVTPQDHYALGVLLYLSGDFAGARQHLAQAPAERRAKAAEALGDPGFFAAAR
ncbi:MAG: hypothetical protein KatS3mg102_0163 [Planctomycetota bacterium]|nr:MAG: hypothetical protein KatS3mg102_0163 [Planctomycetota bacterium]